MPIKQTVKYCTVPATASGGVDITDTMGRTRISSAAVTTADTAINSVAVLPMMAQVLSRSFAPTARPMVTVEPMASPTIITVSMCMTWLPMETAVVLSIPLNRPMINRSAMP